MSSKMGHFSAMVLGTLLAKATPGERQEIARSLKVTSLAPDELAADISFAGGNSIANTTRGHGVGYAEILRDIASDLKITGVPKAYSAPYDGLYLSEWDQFSEVDKREVPEFKALDITWAFVKQSELLISTRLFEGIYNGLASDKRKELDEFVAKQNKGLGGIAGGAATMVALKAGGLATYMAMSSILSFLSVGLLPFAAYTTASSVLAAVLGPVGWAALGLATVYKLGSPNRQKLCAVVIQIAVLRAKYEGQK